MSEWTVAQQCEPRAIDCWNLFAEGDASVLEELTRFLKEDFPTFCGLALKVRPKGGGYFAS